MSEGLPKPDRRKTKKSVGDLGRGALSKMAMAGVAATQLVHATVPAASSEHARVETVSHSSEAPLSPRILDRSIVHPDKQTRALLEKIDALDQKEGMTREEFAHFFELNQALADSFWKKHTQRVRVGPDGRAKLDLGPKFLSRIDGVNNYLFNGQKGNGFYAVVDGYRTEITAAHNLHTHPGNYFVVPGRDIAGTVVGKSDFPEDHLKYVPTTEDELVGKLAVVSGPYIRKTKSLDGKPEIDEREVVVRLFRPSWYIERGFLNPDFAKPVTGLGPDMNVAIRQKDMLCGVFPSNFEADDNPLKRSGAPLEVADENTGEMIVVGVQSNANRAYGKIYGCFQVGKTLEQAMRGARTKINY